MRIDAVIGMGKQFVANRKYAPSCGRISFERKFRREIQVLNCKVNLIHWIIFFIWKLNLRYPSTLRFYFHEIAKKMFSDVLDGIYSGTVVRVVLHFRDFHFFWGFHLTQYSCMYLLSSVPPLLDFLFVSGVVVHYFFCSWGYLIQNATRSPISISFGVNDWFQNSA